MMAGEVCERVATSCLGSLLLLAVLSRLAWPGHTVAWATLRVRVTAPAAGTSALDRMQYARIQASAGAERFEAAFTTWLSGQTAALSLMDSVAAGRKPREALADVRAVIVYVCTNGLGNRLPGLVTGAEPTALFESLPRIHDDFI